MEVPSISRLRGRVGVGVFPKNALAERIDFPTRRALPSAIAEAQLRRSYLRTAAEAAYAPPQAGEVTKPGGNY